MSIVSKGSLLPIYESFYTLQGEGYNSGKAAYFIRLAGCDIKCSWCDSKESWSSLNSPLLSIEEIVAKVLEVGAKRVVITGGEPLIHPLDRLTSTLQELEIELFIETSGAYPLSGHFDWITLSPKRSHPPVEELFKRASELKVIIESEEDFEWAELCRERVNESCLLYLQPEWSRREEILKRIIEYIKIKNEWSLSIQSHKYLNIP